MLSYTTTIRYKTPFRCNWSPVPLKRVTSKESESHLEQETAIKLQTPSKIMIAGPYSKLMSHSEHESKKFSSQVCTVKKTPTSYFDVVKMFKKSCSVLEHVFFIYENRSAWGVLVDIATLFVSTKEVHNKTFWLAVKYLKNQILKQLSISAFFPLPSNSAQNHLSSIILFWK